MTSEKHGAFSDEILHDLFRVATIQAQNTMRLSHALQYDSAVSAETRQAATEAFESVEEMLDLLDAISERAWGGIK